MHFLILLHSLLVVITIMFVVIIIMQLALEKCFKTINLIINGINQSITTIVSMEVICFTMQIVQ